MRLFKFILLSLIILSCKDKVNPVANHDLVLEKDNQELLKAKEDSIALANKIHLDKRILTKAQEAQEYCKKNDYNTNYCVLVDMSIHSGKDRLFVFNFNSNKVELKGLCSHGCCDNPWGEDNTKESPVFSNTPESHCSSLGKYKIGDRGYSNWGIHINYKLHGLESTNNNAFKRVIVLHSWEAIPNQEVYPNGAAEGWGCPAVSNELMKLLDNKLKATQKPILFWIYK